MEQANITENSTGQQTPVHEELPVFRGFEYQMKRAVSIPRAWAEFLREVAAHHYDFKCQESAERGIINGLLNTACDNEYPSTYPLGWREFDHLTKVMEQARYHATTPALSKRSAAITEWIRESQRLCRAQEAALAVWDADQEALPRQAARSGV